MALQRRNIPSNPPPLRLAPTPAFIEHPLSKRPTDENHRFVTLERVGRCRIVSRNGKLYIRFYEPSSSNALAVQGRTQRGRQPCVGPLTDIEHARVQAREIDESLNTRGTSGIAPLVVTVDETVHTLLTQLASDPGCAPDTARNYRARWRYVLDYAVEAKVPALRDLTADHARDFERWLAGRLVARNGHPNAPRYPLSPGHQRNIFEAARTLWEKARLLGHVPDAALCPFQPRTRGRRANVVQFPGFEDRKIEKTIVRDFLAACDPWQHRLFLLMLSCGLRCDEVRHMLCEKIDFEKGFYILDPIVTELGWNTKNGKWRLIPILPELRPLFDGLLRRSDRQGILVLDKPLILETREGLMLEPSLEAMKDEYSAAFQQHVERSGRAPTPAEQEAISERIFLSAGALHAKRIGYEFRAVLKKIGVDAALWPHLTRGYTASRAHQAGVDQFVARAVLGHADQKTFDRYCEHDAEFLHREWSKVLDANEPLREALTRSDFTVS